MSPVDWQSVELVIFDVDGTLYDQKRLRLTMVVKLLAETARTRSLDTIRVLRSFRKVREDLGTDGSEDFVERQFELASKACGEPVSKVKSIVNRWIEKEPLRYLAQCRYAGIVELFDSLRVSGRKIGIFSDYGVHDKLMALGLKADISVSAEDADIGKLKPDPKGLIKILEVTGLHADQCLMVGDRFDRDWEVARNAKMRAIIRTSKPDARCPTFKTYRDAIFDPLKALVDKSHAPIHLHLKGNDAS